MTSSTLFMLIGTHTQGNKLKQTLQLNTHESRLRSQYERDFIFYFSYVKVYGLLLETVVKQK